MNLKSRRLLCLSAGLAIGLTLWMVPGCTPRISTELKIYRDADELLALGRYEAALGVHREFIENNPESPGVEGCYLRMAQIFLLTTDSTEHWPGWYGASRVTARDTLRGLLQRRPDTRHRTEVTLWLRLLNHVLALEAESDSLAALVDEQRQTQAAMAGETATVRSERERLQSASRALRTRNRRLSRENSQLRQQARLLQEELSQVREETERMQRMLMDLEGGHSPR